MGTSAFAVPTLVRLCREELTIAGVVTQSDKPSGRGQAIKFPPVKEKALELQLPVFQPVTLRDDAARKLMREIAPDLIVVVAYGRILPPWLLQLPEWGAVNLHGSLLPKYRGAAPIHWAVANGEAETGVCTMRVEAGLDTGAVYLCEKTAILPDETVPALSGRLATMGAELMVRTIQGILAGTLMPQPQDPAAATLAPILKKDHGEIDWNCAALLIHNHIRAFNPWPGTVTRFRGGVCKILRTRVVQGPGGPPGAIIAEKRSLRVCCGDGNSLEILELQPENRKPVAGADFANGARLRSGEEFTAMKLHG